MDEVGDGQKCRGFPHVRDKAAAVCEEMERVKEVIHGLLLPRLKMAGLALAFVVKEAAKSDFLHEEGAGSASNHVNANEAGAW